MYDKMGKWAESVRQHPPHIVDSRKQKSLVISIRQQARNSKYSIVEGDECFICSEDVVEVLRKHHLVLVAAYPLAGNELNEHIAILCENCHDVAHRLIYGERGGISWKSVEKLKEAGYWDRFVELDRMAAEALKVLHKRENQLLLAM